MRMRPGTGRRAEKAKRYVGVHERRAGDGQTTANERSSTRTSKFWDRPHTQSQRTSERRTFNRRGHDASHNCKELPFRWFGTGKWRRQTVARVWLGRDASGRAMCCPKSCRWDYFLGPSSIGQRCRLGVCVSRLPLTGGEQEKCGLGAQRRTS
jgi:hypothetical protein